jgi:PAS domain S-box-containing protein
MLSLGVTNLGFILTIAGGVSIAVAIVLILIFTKQQPSSQANPPSPLLPDLPEHNHAVLVIDSDGKISSINVRAREWFAIEENILDLENLARRTRPSDAFLNICAAEGKTTLTLNGNLLEGNSYPVETPRGTVMVVTLQEPSADSAETTDLETKHLESQQFTALNRLAKAVTREQPLQDTLKTILISVEELIPCDLVEITVQEKDTHLLQPFRLVGIPGMEKDIEKREHMYRADQGYSGYLAENLAPLAISDIFSYTEIRPVRDQHIQSFHSFLGVPLHISNHFLGTIELREKTRDYFTESDLSTLELVAEQASIAIYNALIAQEDRQREQELASLAELSQASKSSNNTTELFSRLLSIIPSLIDVQVTGFLLYDENKRRLQAQTPFLGLPSHVIDIYQTEIPLGSAAEQIWRKETVIHAPEAQDDPYLKDLGLDHIMQASGIQSTVLVPLVSGGRNLGYLQVADKKSGNGFTANDLHLLRIIGGQTAPVIENTTLLHHSIKRALRSEAIRRIANLISSEATIDEILQHSLLELVRLLKAGKGLILLYDDTQTTLTLHKPSAYQLDQGIEEQVLKTLQAFEPHITVTHTASPLLSNQVTADQSLPACYQKLAEALKGTSLISVPILIRNHGTGEMILLSSQENAFNRNDLQLSSAIAGQIAIALEKASLSEATDHTLRQKVEQLTVLTRISQALSSTFDIQQLLEYLFEEAKRLTQADCGSIMLLKKGDTRPILSNLELHIGDDPGDALHNLEQIVFTEGKSQIVDDYHTAQRSTPPPHTGVRSSLLVPISFQNEVAGIIHLHAMDPQRFQAYHQDLLEAIAVQAALALDNAQRFETYAQNTSQLEKRLETISAYLNTSELLSSGHTLNQSLEKIAQGIVSTTPYTKAAIYEYQTENQQLQFTAGAGIPEAERDSKENQSPAWEIFETLLLDQYRHGRVYYIPSEKTSPYQQISISPASSSPVRKMEDPQSLSLPDDKWQPDDILIIPLHNAQGEILGLIHVDQPKVEHKPEKSTLHTLEIFAGQAAQVIENQQKLSDYTEDASQVIREDQVAQLKKRNGRILSSLEILSSINRQPDRDAILRTLAEELLNHVQQGGYLVAEPGPRGPRLMFVGGESPAISEINHLLGRQNPLVECIRNRAPILQSDVSQAEDEVDSPLLRELGVRGFIALPITTLSGTDAVVFVYGQQALPDFQEDEVRLYELLSQQAAHTIQNVRLLTETSTRLSEVNLLLEYSRRLDDLSPDLILQTLVDSVQQLISHSQGMMVVLEEKVGSRIKLIPQITKGYQDPAAMLSLTFSPRRGFIGDVFHSKDPILLNRVNFAQDYNLAKENLLLYREGTGGALPITSLAAPLETRDRQLGAIILENYQEENAFSTQDRALLASLAQQTALTLENVQLIQTAERRAQQLESLTDATATLTSSVLNRKELIETLLDLANSVVPFTTGVLWLHEEGQLSIHSAQGFDNNQDLIGISTQVRDSKLMYEMVRTGKPLLIPNTQEDPRFPSGDHKGPRSWLGVPLFTKGQVLGVIALEKDEAGYYAPIHSQMLQTFGSQAAIAIENASLYEDSVNRAQELNEQTERLSLLNRFSNKISRSLNLEESFQIIINQLAALLDQSRITGLLWTDDQEAVLHTEIPAVETSSYRQGKALPNAPIFTHMQQSHGSFNTRNAQQETNLAPLKDFFEERDTRGLLVLPLATGEETHGFLFIHSEEAQRFPMEEVELARIITNQASIAFQNALLTTNLEQKVSERTQELQREHERAQTLLEVLKALSSSLDLDEVLYHTLSLLNSALDADQSTILLIQPGEDYLFYRASLGYTGSPPRGGRPSTLRKDEGLAGWAIQNNQSELVYDVLEDDRWVPTEKTMENHRAGIIAPIAHGEDILGTISLFSQEPGKFNEYQKEIVHATAKQIAVAINNTQLVDYIQQQTNELGQMLRAQRVEASRSRAILESVADGVIVTNAEQNITLFNEAAERFLNIPKETILDKSLVQFRGLFGESGQEWINTIQEWSSGSINVADVEYSEQITLDTGMILAVQLAPVTYEDEFLGTVSTLRDITHQVEVDRLKSEFIATVSHELRTPMTSIKGYVDVLLMGAAGEMTLQQSDFLHIVKDNTQRLEAIVDDLLDISHLETGRISISIQPIDIKPVIQESWMEIQNKARESQKDLTFQLDVPEDLPIVPADPQRLQQVLSNLLDNAYYYTPEGGSITLRVQPDSPEYQGHLQIDVIDTGVGIPPEKHEDIFERFYRGEDPLVIATPGTGLGLSIVQQLVNIHRGHIWLSSSGVPGEGTTFSFTLPIHKSP